jgi:hypothetical protein
MGFNSRVEIHATSPCYVVLRMNRFKWCSKLHPPMKWFKIFARYVGMLGLAACTVQQPWGKDSSSPDDSPRVMIPPHRSIEVPSPQE